MDLKPTEDRGSKMSSSGKGSRPRPYSVSLDTYGKNFDAIFRKPDPVEGETDDWRERIGKIEGSTPWPFTVQEHVPEISTQSTDVTVDSDIEIAKLEYPNVEIVQTQDMPPNVELETQGVTQEAEIFHPTEGYGRLDGKKNQY